MKFLQEFNFSAFNFCTPGFHAHLIFYAEHIEVKLHKTFHKQPYKYYSHFPSMIGCDKLVISHRIMY